SPVTWVHHLVWLLPALYLAWTAARGRTARALVVAAYALLCTSAVWLWVDGGRSLGAVLGGNLYVWIALALLAFLPIGLAADRHTKPLLESERPPDRALVG
ncbi:MAG TPA: hypothetical protein VK659_33115, partial [Asanoa sp.]|nr:hypothetical protein [Asanoa sp.]